MEHIIPSNSARFSGEKENLTIVWINDVTPFCLFSSTRPGFYQYALKGQEIPEIKLLPNSCHERETAGLIL
jgi:hypothetical protein